jgi:hypothetical protein
MTLVHQYFGNAMRCSNAKRHGEKKSPRFLDILRLSYAALTLPALPAGQGHSGCCTSPCVALFTAASTSLIARVMFVEVAQT